tara:strand:+ start:3352 stop:4395 length:1044 start_codon:yes stop_codon:yes gene_type:complete
MNIASAVVIAIAIGHGNLSRVLPAQAPGSDSTQPQTKSSPQNAGKTGAAGSQAPGSQSPEPSTSGPQSSGPQRSGPQNPAGLLQGKLAQKKRQRRQSATTAVHRAWLTEIIDLDRARAIKDYDNIIRQSTNKQPEKWIAVARLQELGRLGVYGPEPLATPKQAPPEVRKALDLLKEPFPYASVLRDPEANTELPPVRPATPLVQDWVRNQIGPTFVERIRRPRGRRAPTGIRPEWLRYYARDVLKRELEGNRTRANALRTLFFVDFKPMKVTGSRVDLYRTAMKRMSKLIDDESWSGGRNDLRKFEKDLASLVKTAANEEAGAHLAIELIRRIPYYSEKLLAAEKPK